MGTDMHVAVQRRNGERWDRVERPRPNPEFGKYDDEPEFVRNSLYLGRNYLTFAIIAGGRLLDDRFSNSSLQAQLQPAIAPGRGLPPDFASEIAYECHEGTWMGQHSFTWLSLTELESYNWDREIVRDGWVSAPLRAVHLECADSYPQRWLSHWDESSGRKISLEEMDEEIRAGKIDPNAYALATWNQRLRIACADLLDLLPALQALTPSSDDVRLVIGFDS